MRRKLVKQGSGALTVTLPAKWCKKHGLKAGGEVDMSENTTGIVISPKYKNAAIRLIDIDISSLQERVIRWILSAFNKKGYDEIRVKYDSSIQLKVVSDLVKNLFTGFLIVNQSKKHLTIKNISLSSDILFDELLNRAFLITLSMSEELVNHLKTNEASSVIDILDLEKSNNQVTNLCERILITNLSGDDNAFFKYIIAWNLEKICDEYKYIANYVCSKKEMRIKHQTLSFFNLSNHFLRKYYALYNSFSLTSLNSIYVDGKNILKSYIALLDDGNVHDKFIVHHLVNVVYSIMDFFPSTTAIYSES